VIAIDADLEPTNGPLQVKLDDWPEGDRCLWNDANRPRRLLEIATAVKSWRPGTKATVVKSYGRYLGYLRDAGALDPVMCPEDRCTLPLIEAYVQSLSGKAPYTIASYLQGLAMGISRMSPKADIDWLWEIVNAHLKHAEPTRCKRERIVPIQDLYELGFRLMDEAYDDDPVLSAVRYRDGLMIALLAAMPIRIKNLQMMEIGKHIVPAGRSYDLRFTPNETKMRKPLEAELPVAVKPAIDDYLELHRPKLLGRCKNPVAAPVDAMWVSRFGTQMAASSIHARICEVTGWHLPNSINPHLFRDCAATSIATDDPEHVGITMGVLGHSNPRTAEKSYNHALTRNAAARQADALSKLRKRLEAKAKISGLLHRADL
jgi:integrase/recombinase XerD